MSTEALRPTESRTDRDPAHFGFVDALRGWAFLGVFFTHAVMYVHGLAPRLTSFLMGGHYGVHLFFMMSAFTLFHSIHSRSPKPGWIRDFFLRRLFRIGPMFWFAIVAFSLARLGEQGVLPQWPELLVTATLLHGFSVPYINSLVGGQWSIGDEVIFYAFVPILARVVRSLPAAIAASIAFLAFNSVANAAAKGFVPAGEVQGFTTLWLPNHVFAFAIGFVLYFVLEPNAPRAVKGFTKRFAPAFLWGGLTATTFLLCYERSVPVPQKVAILCLFTFVIGLSHVPNAFFVNAFTRYVGTVSYSAYVVHFLVLDFCGHFLLPHLAPDQPYVRLAAITVVGLPVSLLASNLTYRWIEVPGQEIGRRAIRRLNARPSG